VQVPIPPLQRQVAFAHAQTAACETEGHRVRVVVLLRAPIRDVRAEDVEVLQTPPLPSTILPTTSAGPYSVLDERSRDPDHDDEGGKDNTNCEVNSLYRSMGNSGGRHPDHITS